MALRRGDIADAAVAVFVIVPLDEAPGPLPGRIQIGKSLEREFWPILGGAKQCFSERIVIADPRTRVGRCDAQPMQHRQHGGGLQSGTIVTMQDRTRRTGMHVLGECRSPGQVRGVIGTVRVVHFKTDDLAAVEVEDQVEIEPPTLDLSRQKRHVPAPDLAGTAGNMRGWRARCPRWLSASTAVHLAMRTQHAMKAGLAGDVDTFVGQGGYDPRRWRLGKARFIANRDDLGSFGLAQRMRWRRMLGGWPRRPLATAPALPRLRPPDARQPPPLNSQAAVVAPRSYLCMPVRIEPLFAIRAPKGSDPILSGQQLV